MSAHFGPRFLYRSSTVPLPIESRETRYLLGEAGWLKAYRRRSRGRRPRKSLKRRKTSAVRSLKRRRGRARSREKLPEEAKDWVKDKAHQAGNKMEEAGDATKKKLREIDQVMISGDEVTATVRLQA